MKKLFSLFCICSLLVGCSSTSTAASSPTPSATTESSLNAGKIELETNTPDMSAYIFMTDDDPAFLEVTSEESLKLFNNGGTGVVVYSYESCPWCNRVLPILNEVAKELGKTVFYVNIYSNSFMAQDTEKKSEIIDSLYQVLDPILETDTDEETGEEKKVMQVPEVIAVKDGEIKSHHLGIVDGFTLDQDHLSEFQVTDSQKEELKEIYREMFQSIE